MRLHNPDPNETVQISDEQYRLLIRAYQLESGRRLLITRKGLGDSAIYFYAEQDALVRLTPRSDNRFTSERGELLTFQDEHLTVHDVQGQYDQAYREEQIKFAGNGEHTLAGSLLIPNGDTPHPAIILYHLANVHERDYYRIYADYFARHGIATLIYDKRGHGESTGDPLSSQIYHLADDAGAAFQFLRQHPRIDPQRIGVWGMSNGGWVDLLVATRQPEVALVINLSASGVPPSRQEQIRRINVSRLAGATDDQLRFLDSFWKRLFAFLIHSEWASDLEAALLRLQREPEWRELVKETGGLWLLDTPIEVIKREYGGAWRDGDFDPVSLYTKLRCPILCLWGDEDSVLPVPESITSIQRALHSSGHPDWTVWSFPQATHLLYLNRAGFDAQTNEAMHEQLQDVHFPPALFPSMLTWAKKRLHVT